MIRERTVDEGGGRTCARVALEAGHRRRRGSIGPIRLDAQDRPSRLAPRLSAQSSLDATASSSCPEPLFFGGRTTRVVQAEHVGLHRASQQR